MELNIFRGITLPAKVVEGAISIADTVSVTGDSKKPTLETPVAQGDAVVALGEQNGMLKVEKATGSNGVVIGFAHDHPEYDVDPTTGYTKAQAVSADMLRKCGVDTAFADVRTVDAKASESIAAGMYVEWSADGYKKTASSGTTVSDTIALTAQGTDNRIVIGIK